MTALTQLRSRYLRARSKGHNLLEALIATGIFIMVSVALSGIWVMYGRSLAKSAEILAGNSVARSVSEGLISNGWNYLKTLEGTTPPPEAFVVDRVVRGKQANIKYDAYYEVVFNDTGTGAILQNDIFSKDLCQITVTVRWNSTAGSNSTKTGYNSEVTYSTIVYKKGMTKR